MERLTKKHYGGNGYYMACSEHCNKECFDCKEIDKIIDRLGTYEDTGLEPEEIADFMKRWEQTVEIGGMLKKYCIDHIRDLLHAEQDGRLVVLPCKAGDHVWVDGREAVVENFFGYETERYLHAQFYDNMQYIDIPFAEIGKTVFLTREEAEAALALKGGEG